MNHDALCRRNETPLLQARRVLVGVAVDLDDPVRLREGDLIDDAVDGGAVGRRVDRLADFREGY
jgi:hypothetical protein